MYACGSLHHRQIHPAEDDAIDRDAEIERAKASKECGGLCCIADFGEFHVRHDALASCCQSREKKNTVSIPLATKFHQSQLPALPFRATIPVTASGVSAAKVVATMEVPANHHGTFLPPRKNSPVFFPARACSAEPHRKIEQEVEGDYRPIEAGELHKFSTTLWITLWKMLIKFR